MGTSEINDDSRRANRPSDTELPSQLLQAKRWRELAEVLSDYEFADMKVAAGMTDELVADHRTAEAALPEGALSDEMVAVLRDWREFVCSESSPSGVGARAVRAGSLQSRRERGRGGGCREAPGVVYGALASAGEPAWARRTARLP